ncbi:MULTISPECIES: hypothetical protein [Cyanophyceae]|uniref:hypothetical protein n=1 Tax=Cyanophyceae TaxID=3028117 RepID=UPI0016838FD9|nr:MULTISPECIES: hypothetical protein [Cyanophyceae]MBD1919432.1 hypothetical protein [Phormidium sp. FACHB-77]MBD2054284.1 hypothetical protein [Leptolyngbya sp. FACHB-60]
MDPATLTAFLVPFLPYLLKTGSAVADTASKHFSETMGTTLGTQAYEKAKALWSKLQPKVISKPMAKGAAEQLAQTPDNSEAQKLLISQLKQLLAEDKTLAAEIQEMMSEDEEMVSQVITNTITQQTKGDHNKVIGVVHGDAHL